MRMGISHATTRLTNSNICDKLFFNLSIFGEVKYRANIGNIGKRWPNNYDIWLYFDIVCPRQTTPFMV